MQFTKYVHGIADLPVATHKAWGDNNKITTKQWLSDVYSIFQ